MLLLIFSILLMTAPMASAADLPLPASPWYAVTWEEASDTLHWINASGEQASIARPKLEGQASQAQTRLHISPDGRFLVVISPLVNGHEGIGFYNFQTGQFVQTHESQDNEVFLPAGKLPFTETSTHFAVPLRNNATGDWRLIVFETATGNAVDVLSRTDTNMPPGFNTDTGWWPQVVNFNLDEGLNTLEVRFQFVTQINQMPLMFDAFNWRIPPVANTDTVLPFTFGWSPLVGFDIQPQTGEIVFGLWDAQNAPAPSPGAANRIHYQASPNDVVQNLAQELGGSTTLPLWLNNGNWIGYYRNDGAHMPHWLVMDKNGQGGVPLSPDYIGLYHTSDGFLAKNSTVWKLDHGTTLNFEGFSDPAGTTIYQPGAAFAVVYTTPATTPFLLPSVAEPFAPVPQGPGDIAAPQGDGPIVCPPFNMPPRLTVGGQARVTFTDGSNLNIRTEPAGSLVTQIAEGSIVNVFGGPVCAEGYLYWNVQVADDLSGWAAEGGNGVYYLEPWPQGGGIPQGPGDLAAPATATPFAPPQGPGDLAAPVTATPFVPPQGPGDLAAPPTATPTNMPLVFIPIPTATPTNPPLVFVPVPLCTGSPESRLHTNMAARTVQPSGTLALRLNLSDEIPQHQVPAGLNVQIVGGPDCRANLRMWQIQVTLNGQQVTGWVAEGSGQTYYLAPPLGLTLGS
jgi:hypothetical protein